MTARACVVFLTVLLLSQRSAQAEVLEANDLSTPRRAMTTFVDAANHEDWQRAIAVLGVARNEIGRAHV